MTYDYFDLWNRLPKKYRDRVKDFYAEYGLIGDCEYMLEFADPWRWFEYPNVPVRNITEAIQFTKEAERYTDES